MGGGRSRGGLTFAQTKQRSKKKIAPKSTPHPNLHMGTVSPHVCTTNRDLKTAPKIHTTAQPYPNMGTVFPHELQQTEI
jgi:hypothetical protein